MWIRCNKIIAQYVNRYKYYFSGHYPSPCLYLKSPSCSFFKTQRFETGFSLRLQAKPTQQVKTGRRIMSISITFVLMYHPQTFLDLIFVKRCWYFLIIYPPYIHPCDKYVWYFSFPEDHARGLSTFTIMAGLGGFLGYALGAINWDITALGKLVSHQYTSTYW
jgi:hypothetical protein